MAFEKKYMERAIELARKGIGAVNPNPLVGAVIVRDGVIVGEGYHTKYGELHAEREAIKNATERGEDITGTEMYVTLEPCSHTGKQPPCTEAIIEAGIKRVYVGSSDPNPLVSGNGVWQLRDAGVEVVTGCMSEACDELNPVFFHYITQQTPYVVYKYAMTMDGKTCTRIGKSRWISGEKSRHMVQEMRNEYMAIMVGIGTVLKDDPSLRCHLGDQISEGDNTNDNTAGSEGTTETEKNNAREIHYRNPIRIIIDSRLRIPLDSQIVRTAKETKTYVASLAEYEKQNRQKIRELRDYGVGTLLIPADPDSTDKRVDLKKLMIQLGKMKIDSVLLEGGGELAWSMIKEDFVQEIRCFIAPKVFGGRETGSPLSGVGIDEVEEAKTFELVETRVVDGDIYAKYLKR